MEGTIRIGDCEHLEGGVFEMEPGHVYVVENKSSQPALYQVTEYLKRTWVVVVLTLSFVMLLNEEIEQSNKNSWFDGFQIEFLDDTWWGFCTAAVWSGTVFVEMLVVTRFPWCIVFCALDLVWKVIFASEYMICKWFLYFRASRFSFLILIDCRTLSTAFGWK